MHQIYIIRILSFDNVGRRGSMVEDTACALASPEGGRGFDPTSRQIPEGKLEVRKTNAAISPVCLRDRHLLNAPVNISGWKRGARQLTKKRKKAMF